jgi:hypothetical protein
MRKVFKYTLVFAEEQTLTLPLGAQILHVALQHGQPRLWALVDVDIIDTTPRNILMRGTGHAVEALGVLDHISTMSMDYGDLILHWFEEVQRAT